MNDTPDQRKYFDGVKVLEAAISLFFLLILAAVLLGFFYFSHPWIDRYVFSTLKSAGADSCSVGKVSVAFWNGIEIRDLRFSGGDRSSSYTLNLDRLKISCNLFSSVLKWKKVKDDYEILSIDSLKHAAENPLFINTLLRFASEFDEFREMDIVCRDFILKQHCIDLVEFKDVVIDFERKKEDEKVIQADISLAQVMYLNNLFTNLRAEGTIAHGVVDLTRCKGKTLGGKFRFNAELDARSNRLHEFSLSASELDLQQLLSIPDSCPVKITGKTDIDLELAPGHLRKDLLRGKGEIRITRFQSENLPVQNAIMQLLEIPSVTKLSFSKLKINFDVQKDETFLTSISGNGDILDFKADGWIQTNGTLNEKIEATLSPDLVKTVSKTIAASLTETPGGGREVRCRLYGSLQEPKVELDKEIMKKAVSNVFEQMKESIQEFFK